MELLIYRYSGATTGNAEARPDARLSKWRPSLRSMKPGNKRWKYVFYSVFHWARIFRNRDYCLISVEADGEQKASMLVVPAHFRWPFMGRKDVQLTYVLTSYGARRQGWASYLVNHGVCQLAREDREIWYVTDTNNVASQRLAERSGFELVGKAEPRKSRFQRVRLTADGRLRDAP